MDGPSLSSHYFSTPLMTFRPNQSAHSKESNMPPLTSPSSPLYLGFDLSTQQLKVVALTQSTNSNGRIGSLQVHSSFAVAFDAELPYYKTRGGVHVHDSSQTSGAGAGAGAEFEKAIDGDRDKGVVTAPVLMWIEALERVLEKMQEAKFPFDQVESISGAAQQHGSVYWSKDAKDAFQKMAQTPSTPSLQDLCPQKGASLVEIMQNAFTVQNSPIWQDTSTTEQCREMEEYLGCQAFSLEGNDLTTTSARVCGQQCLAERTGSRAYERYTASQVLKIVQRQPEVYASTVRISLVSSFLASVLIGKFASIDVADGSGMNLLNLNTKQWDPLLTMFVSQGGAKGLEQGHGPVRDTLMEKLGDVDSTGQNVGGTLSPWFVNRYGFRSNVNIVSFTGDNPATVLAIQAEPGDAIVSLGTSDTLLLYTNHHHGPSGTSTLSTKQNNNNRDLQRQLLSTGYLAHPTDPNGYLMLYCAKNGSLARQTVRDLYADRDWEQFSQYLNKAMHSRSDSSSVETKDDTDIGFYYFEREIWPPVQGIRRFQHGKRVEEFAPIKKDDHDQVKRANILAICESQFLSMRICSSQSNSLNPSPASEAQLSPPGISRILATGGASSNPTLLQLLANVFGVSVLSMGDQHNAGESAALGAARKAFIYGRRQHSSSHLSTEQQQSSSVVSAVLEPGHAPDYDDTEGTRQTKSAPQIVYPNLEQTKRYVAQMAEFSRLQAELFQVHL